MTVAALPKFLATAPPQPPMVPHDDPTDTFWDDLRDSSNRWDERATRVGVAVEQLQAPERSLTAPGVGAGPDYAAGPPIESVATTPQLQHQEEPPPLVSRHIVETQNVGAELVRARVVPVVGNQVPTTLLDYNPHRTRALIKVITSNQVVLIGPFRQGGAPTLTAAPTQGMAHYPQATGDPILEIKSSAAVEAYGVQAAGAVTLIAIWEEQVQPD